MIGLTRVEFWVDGSCRNGHLGPEKGVMGAGIVGVQPPHYREWSVHLGKGTSQRAELLAIREALLRIQDRSHYHIVINTDSAYSIGALTGSWSLKKNLETIASVVVLIAECGRFEMVKVAGHSGHIYNEVAHRLAVTASKGSL